MGLFVATTFLELTFQGVHAVVDGFLEGVGYLVGEQILAAGHVQAHRRLLVHGSLGFHDLEYNLGIRDLLIVLSQFFHFLVDDVIQFLGCIKVDGIDFNFLINLLF